MKQLINKLKLFLDLQGVQQYACQIKDLDSFLKLVRNKCERNNRRYSISMGKDKHIVAQFIHPRVMYDSLLINFEEQELDLFVSKFSFGIMIPTFDMDSQKSSLCKEALNEIVTKYSVINKTTINGLSNFIFGFTTDFVLMQSLCIILNKLHGYKLEDYLKIEFTYWNHKEMIKLES